MHSSAATSPRKDCKPNAGAWQSHVWLPRRRPGEAAGPLLLLALLLDDRATVPNNVAALARMVGVRSRNTARRYRGSLLKDGLAVVNDGLLQLDRAAYGAWTDERGTGAFCDPMPLRVLRSLDYSPELKLGMAAVHGQGVRAFKNGQAEDGSRWVPFDAHLAEEHGLDRATIKAARQALVAEGFGVTWRKRLRTKYGTKELQGYTVSRRKLAAMGGIHTGPEKARELARQAETGRQNEPRGVGNSSAQGVGSSSAQTIKEPKGFPKEGLRQSRADSPSVHDGRLAPERVAPPPRSGMPPTKPKQPSRAPEKKPGGPAQRELAEALAAMQGKNYPAAEVLQRIANGGKPTSRKHQPDGSRERTLTLIADHAALRKIADNRSGTPIGKTEAILAHAGYLDKKPSRRQAWAQELVRKMGRAAPEAVALLVHDIARDGKAGSVGAILTKRLPLLLSDNWRQAFSRSAPQSLQAAHDQARHQLRLVGSDRTHFPAHFAHSQPLARS